jgi:hypothetical protein
LLKASASEDYKKGKQQGASKRSDKTDEWTSKSIDGKDKTKDSTIWNERVLENWKILQSCLQVSFSLIHRSLLLK